MKLTLEQKTKLIEEIVENLRSKLVARVEELPEDWDGYEIRKWIGEYYEVGWLMTMPGARTRRYRNEVLTRRLV